MDYLEEMEKGEVELRKLEGSVKKSGPPEGMDRQAWNIDRFYLQYMLRLKARQLHYNSWSRKENVRLNDVDFQAMEIILHSRQELVKKDRLLMGYLRTISALQLVPTAPETPLEIEKTLIKIVNDRSEMEVEDYVYLTTYLANYALIAHSKKQGDYDRLMLISQIPTIEAKFGVSWKKGDKWLGYRFLVNLTLSAMNLARKEAWRGLSMDLVKDVDETGTVYDWVEEVLKAYKSRLKEDDREATLAYVRAYSAFLQKDYSKVADQLMLIGKKSFEFLGLNICQLRLIAYYELLYRHGVKEKPKARKLEPDAKKTIGKMRDYLKDLDRRQGRKTTQQASHYLTFINSFSALLTLTEKADMLPVGSDQRFQYLFQPRIEQLEKLKDYDYLTGKWLSRQLKTLQ
jgi:hypothetical protein